MEKAEKQRKTQQTEASGVEVAGNGVLSALTSAWAAGGGSEDGD